MRGCLEFLLGSLVLGLAVASVVCDLTASPSPTGRNSKSCSSELKVSLKQRTEMSDADANVACQSRCSATNYLWSYNKDDFTVIPAHYSINTQIFGRSIKKWSKIKYVCCCNPPR